MHFSDHTVSCLILTQILSEYHLHITMLNGNQAEITKDIAEPLAYQRNQAHANNRFTSCTTYLLFDDGNVN